MVKSARRLGLWVVLCAVGAGAGSALCASTAFAGMVDTSSGYLDGALYNATPYTWTKVAQGSPQKCYITTRSYLVDDCWTPQEPADRIAPGGSTGYTVAANLRTYPALLNAYSTEFGYNAWVTYRVDVLGGAPEYVTFAVSQCYCTFTYGNGYPSLQVWDTTTPPPASYNPGIDPTSPAPATAKPQITYAHNTPYMNDQTFQIAGDYTVDASSDLGAPFVGVLNTLCAGATNTSCSFTQTTPLTWGIGDPSSPYGATNCSAPGGDEPNYFQVEYEAAQTASLSVGGGVTASAEFNLFDVVAVDASISIEAEHEWQEVKSITRSAKVYIPPNDIAYIWVVPTVGKVTGTLVVSNGSAKFTATNFTETRSGVSKDTLTPAYDVITKVRPMTAAERAEHCSVATPATLLGGRGAAPPVKLVEGQPATKVKLGQTPAQVVKELGQPAVKRYMANPCQGIGSRCAAVAATGGRWSYRKLSVVFGPDLRVSGLLYYSAAQRSPRRVGVGSSPAAVRGAYPGVSCSRSGRRMTCTLTGAYAGQVVKTVYRFSKSRTGRYACDRVLVYLTTTVAG